MPFRTVARNNTVMHCSSHILYGGYGPVVYCTQAFPWQERPLKYNRDIMGVVEAMEEAMGGDFDVVHVRRGDKLREASRWPHLDHDTRAPA